MTKLYLGNQDIGAVSILIPDETLQSELDLEQIVKGGAVERQSVVVTTAETNLLNVLGETYRTITFSVTPATATVTSTYTDRYTGQEVVTTDNPLVVPIQSTVFSSISASNYVTQNVVIQVELDNVLKAVTLIPIYYPVIVNGYPTAKTRYRATPSNSLEWSTFNLPINGTTAPIYNKGMWIHFDSSSKIYYTSTDLVNWTEREKPVEDGTSFFIYKSSDNNLYASVGTSLYRSIDNITWEKVSDSIPVSSSSLLYNNGIYSIKTSTVIYKSTDLVNWTSCYTINISNAMQVNCLVVNGTFYWFIYNQNDRGTLYIITSDDLVQFTQTTKSIPYVMGLSVVKCEDSIFVVGTSGYSASQFRTSYMHLLQDKTWSSISTISSWMILGACYIDSVLYMILTKSTSTADTIFYSSSDLNTMVEITSNITQFGGNNSLTAGYTSNL